MTDAVSICNLALQRVGAKSIANLSENSTAGRACNRIYTQARDSELRSHDWSFARERVKIAADSTAPTFGFTKRYQLPADCVRIQPTNGTNATPNQEDFQIEGRFVLTDTGSPINLVYTKRVTDEETFDDLFVELLIARIAMDIAEKVTQSNTKKDEATLHYKSVQREARRINAFERSPQQPPTDDWENARL